MLRKLVVSVYDEVYGDLQALAFRKRTPMAALVRYALDRTFEGALDVIGGERALEEAAKDPSGSISWEEYKARRSRGVQAAS